MLLNVIEGPYLRDLLEQPAALQRTWEHLADEANLRKVTNQIRQGR